MNHFTVEPPVWDLFPDCEIGVLLLKEVNNTEEISRQHGEVIAGFLQKAEKDAGKHLTEPVLSQNPVVGVWREAFSKFKTKKRC